jgi:hypothetical protein
LDKHLETTLREVGLKGNTSNTRMGCLALTRTNLAAADLCLDDVPLMHEARLGLRKQMALPNWGTGETSTLSARSFNTMWLHRCVL